ncbi:hypothetical protein J7E93_11555 [Streptomyces sp. ISL-36]|uniref:hypothetical protein n=1 Tax=Streptomyces sp. ISL-36 TaxID=2819182 RepID=UPI001BE56070|nr:hypothetical protein [Streptomyces sp. ISL-36]MBT2440731.1 hypothetical protein [Streptomyces sp. ISL-36]
MGEEEKTVRPRRGVWIRWAALLTVLCGGPIALLIWGATAWSEAGEPKPVDCTEAMDFARGTLPPGATDARCTAAHWQETRVQAEFRMERGKYEPWLAAVYPERKPSPYCPHGQAGCLRVEYGAVLSVTLGVTYEDGDTVLVRLTAFDH